MLIAYDDDGNVVSTLDYMVGRDASGRVVGLVDFEAHEASGGEMLDVWRVDTHDPTHPVKGSKAWPECIGAPAYDFRVELDGPPGRKHIAALVHKTSGHRRERADIEAAIAERISSSAGQPADIRDLVGGPDRPLRIDSDGRTHDKSLDAPRPDLPLVRRIDVGKP